MSMAAVAPAEAVPLNGDTLELVRSHMSQVAVPSAYDKVFKEECMFSFDTPESAGGLYINLKTFRGYGEQYVDLDHEKTGQVLYLHEKWHRVPLSKEELAEREAAPEKLALGGQGGFQVDAKDYTIQKQHHLAIMPARLTVPLPCPELPELVNQAVAGIMAHDSASVQEQVTAWEEERKVSKYAEGLEQLDTGRTIPSDPKHWRCEETGATENLWLNLSTGQIGSGRQHWDGTGGTGSALRHYEATGRKYPLVVKLGTITPHGADVYSYAADEDDMVDDPWLAQHLRHWGINMMDMTKTEKSMAELQIQLNQSFEFDKITEAGSQLAPLSGPGYVGLTNLGNSCYMNSVLQVLATMPLLCKRYAEAADQVYRTAPPESQNDFPTQMAKMAVALIEGRTGQGPFTAAVAADANGDAHMADAHAATPVPVTQSVRPQFFKSLVGRGHPEFSSMHQQDAVDYLQHLLEVMSRAEHAAANRLGAQGLPPTGASFRFEVEDRLQCCASGAVSYKTQPHLVLGLNIPLEAATNKEAVEAYKEKEQKRARLKQEGAAAYIGGGMAGEEGGAAVESKDAPEPVIPQVPFAACLSAWQADEALEDVRSAALGGRTAPATKRQRFGTFPPYLLVQMRRYFVDKDWTPKKMEVLVDVPDRLDLEHLRAKGPQPGEVLQPQDEAAPAAAAAAHAPAAAPAAAEPDPQVVSGLTAMGFSENGAKRASLAVGRAGLEAATEWVFAHMEDPDFNDPLPPAGAAVDGGGGGAAAGGDSGPSAEQLSMLTAMGFADRQAAAALKACGGSVERAADWLFSHMDDLDAAVAQAEGAAQEAAAAGSAPAGAAAGGPGSAPLDDGRGEYELTAIISHMGSNTACGHYVAHIKKDGRWAIFNDEKVAISEAPPRQLGYMYMFRRVDLPQQ